jgi:RNA-directed DNA polymerase
MTINSPHRYRLAGLQQGVAREVLDEAARQAGRIRAATGATPVFTLKHLAHMSGASYVYLREIVQRRQDPYMEFSRRRSNGQRMRLISAPNPPLMAVQRWINTNVAQHLPVHSDSVAYMPGDSVVEAARRHAGSIWLVKVDVRDFFHSIDECAVYKVLRRSGYNPLVSLEIARICTRARHGPFIPRHRRYTVDSYYTQQLGVLPQGGPTSGSLANAVMHEADTRLSQLALTSGLVYTRYADDMTFSSSDPFDRRRAAAILREVRIELNRHGLRMHDRKTRVCPPGARRIVLGLNVNDAEVRLQARTRQRIDHHLRGVETFGLAHHSQHHGFDSVFGFVRHIDGLLAFASSVEPDWTRERRARWRTALGGIVWE